MRFGARLFNCTDLQSVLGSILDGSMELTGATLGNVQLMDWETGYLTIATQRGFRQEFLDFFRRVNTDNSSACGRALKQQRAVVIKDVMSDEDFAPYRAVAEQARFRSVQSTPIVSSSGVTLGVVSTHFAVPHGPTKAELNAVRLLARVAAGVIIRMRARPGRSSIRAPWRTKAPQVGNQYRARHLIEISSWRPSMTMAGMLWCFLAGASSAVGSSLIPRRGSTCSRAIGGNGPGL